MSELQKVLMRRDGLTAAEAMEEINDMRQQIYDHYANPEELLYYIGLEPDYVIDLLL